MRKRLGSLLLALTLAATCIPAAAMAADEDVQTIQIDDAGADIVDSSGAIIYDDPETYKATHRGENEELASVQRSTSKIMTFASSTIESIYTKKTYTVPEGEITNGIDVSKWSKDIDWQKVKDAGTDWTIIRVAYTGTATGKQNLDEYFKTNITAANKLGIPAGVYIYSQANSVEMAKAEAQYCLDNIKGYNIDLPVVMDVEFAENSNGSYTGVLYNAKLTKAEQTEICEAFCETIENAGYRAMIYANKSMLTNNMNADELSEKYPIWLANYTTKTSYTGDYDVWQYSDSGVVSGIDYAIDCNFGIDFLSNIKPSEPENTLATIALDRTKASLTVGETKALSATVTPSGTAVQWSTSDESVATVKNGQISAVGVGTAVITASAGEATAQCTVTVKPTQVTMTSVKATTDKYLRVRWEAAKGAAKYYVYRSESGINGDFHKVRSTTSLTWKDKTIEQGKRYYYRVKAVNTINGTKYNGKVSASLSGVSGQEKLGITLSSAELKLPISTSQTLTATTTPAKSVEPVTWSSSNAAVATVDNGALTAVSMGSTTVTASFCGVTASCAVSVVPQALDKISAKVSDKAIKITWGTSEGATRYYLYRSATGEDGTWGKAICSTKKKTFTDTDVTEGEIYYYHVVAAAKASDGKYYRADPSPTRVIAAIFDSDDDE